MFYTPVVKTITVPGKTLELADQLHLNAGWNQIVYWGSDGATPAVGFGCLAGNFDALVAEAGKVYVPGSPFNTLKNLVRGKGYFIHTTAPVTLRYSCQ